ncbi:DNA-binding protein [Brachyspira hampsonii]|uniref:DNA-binding protein n=1 Tax=Brachyspira hampsonii TaxID=1287055 RepID=A0A1E5NI05_9SPIR|nr:DNA-binding protein [Brachyspira hampsonii]OEJ15792.1 DNA-binding protein [Brachyspira hampsonii]
MSIIEKDNFKIHYSDDFEIIDIEERDINDKEKRNQYSHCMSNVDLMIKANDKIIFIELKNFQIEDENGLENEIKALKIEEPLNKDSIIYELIQKGRGSFLKEYSSGYINNDIDVYYFIIFHFPFKIRNMRFKSNINKCLKTNLPIIKTDSIYKKSFIKSILFITIDEWKEISKNINAEKIIFEPISKSQCIPKP